MIKMSIEINAIKYRKTYINKKSWFFKKLNNADTFLVKMTKIEREKTNCIRNNNRNYHYISCNY